MNDTELDEMLDRWTVPPVPTSLRESVRAGFATSLPPAALPRERVGWSVRKTLFAAAVAGVGAFLLMVGQALSQMPPPEKIPYTVDSEFVRYGDDGSRTVEMYSTSYVGQHGEEIVLSRSIPGHPLETALGRTLDAALPVWQRMILPYALSSKDMETYRKMRQSGFQQIVIFAGCSDWSCLTTQHWGFRRAPAGGDNACLEGPVVARETILSYPTEAVERPLWNRGRITLWMAKDLGCFALRVTTEEGPRSDGNFQLLQTRQALKVSLNP